MTAPEAATVARTGSLTPARATARNAQWAAASVALFVALWWLASAWTTEGLVPNPWEVAQTFWELCTTPFAELTLPGHVLSSLSRWGVGFAWAAVLGVLLGLSLGAFATVRAAVTPIFEFLRYIPPFAWIPLAVLWLGAAQSSAALIVFIAAFPPVVISTQVGVAGVDPALLRAARSLGAGRLRTITQIVAPVSVPEIFTGIRIAVSNGWMALIAAELISGTEGVGFLIIQGQESNNVTIVMAGMVAIGITGAVVTGAVNLLGTRLTRWRKTSETAN
ncbi:NitT/TauT family transport system permease protein/taurine transport system permease protein/sulfonate transport system permease protein [Haloactinopolyspora alba]|uniref:NitT/TauT family transport system permease protein/taurine transport system permease protein/sulfonate transport system permease protein n=1 Tax=Haloactinopolyspora alba TaxID=648780 RepID=A0A2P8E049_9ACTN|nr:ABC transporter permease [Haloactinopolyspora alba]PSL02840.1 NitT/TauT family transport system permease protein/taurine transport system permease protein/sulfonate transport system permease protein [Haloactinopolyspora alba]